MSKLIFNGTDYQEIDEQETKYLDDYGEIIPEPKGQKKLSNPLINGIPLNEWLNPKLIKQKLLNSCLCCGAKPSEEILIFNEEVKKIEVNSENVFPSMVIVGGNKDFHKRTPNKFKRYLRSFSA